MYFIQALNIWIEVNTFASSKQLLFPICSRNANAWD